MLRSMLRMLKPNPTEETWRSFLNGESRLLRRGRRMMGMIPAAERCKNCHAPLTGAAAPIMRIIGRGRYNRNPKFCTF